MEVDARLRKAVIPNLQPDTSYDFKITSPEGNMGGLRHRIHAKTSPPILIRRPEVDHTRETEATVTIILPSLDSRSNVRCEQRLNARLVRRCIYTTLKTRTWGRMNHARRAHTHVQESSGRCAVNNSEPQSICISRCFLPAAAERRKKIISAPNATLRYRVTAAHADSHCSQRRVFEHDLNDRDDKRTTRPRWLHTKQMHKMI